MQLSLATITLIVSLCFITRLHTASSENATDPPTILDDSCQTPANLKDLSVFKYEDYENISIYSSQLRFPSYVGYPCSVDLWTKYHEQFQMPLLRCPFGKDLDPEFNEFKLNYIKHEKNRPLHFQLICFARQMEICEPLNPPPTTGTDCLGVCKCMDPIDIIYPDSLTPQSKYTANQILETGIRCGIPNGRACIPSWKFEFDSNSTDPTAKECEGIPALEARHFPNKNNFYLQCEQNAGCHEEKKICECAVGHKCSNSGGAKKQISEKTYTFLMITIISLHIAWFS